MIQINPYLIYNGNAKEAFKLYNSVLGGKMEIKYFKEMPESDKMPEEEQNKVMHASLDLGNNIILMGSDFSNMENPNKKYNQGNNFHLTINPNTEEEADKFFNGLSKEGKIEMQMQKTFWNAYFGSFIDKFGIQWMINFEYS